MTHANQEHTEVVRVRGDHADTDVYSTAESSESVEHVDSVTFEPHARRAVVAHKLSQAIYLLFGFFEILLGLRLLLRLLGANPASPFTRFLYEITRPLLAPFVGIFPNFHFRAGTFEPETVIAIIILVLLAWLLARLVRLLLDDQGVGTARSTHAYRHRYP